MVNRKTIVIIASVCIVLLSVIGYLIYREMDARHVPILEQQEQIQPETIPTPILTEETPNATESPQITHEAMVTPTDALPVAEHEAPESTAPIPSVKSAVSTPKYSFGSVTILDKTFEVKEGIDEATLKKNIGWMESSAVPGQEGTTVLMGHRNTQLRVLKDILIGDAITFTASDGAVSTYIVQSAEVVPRDTELSFSTPHEYGMVLLTCYPFYFKGNAPDKFVVVATMQ